MTEVNFLECEKEQLSTQLNLNNYEHKFITKSDLNKIEIDILFVLNKSNLANFIPRELNNESHHILETLNITYIVINSIGTLNDIYNNFEDILIVKFDEDRYTNKVFKFFRIKDKKYYTIVKNFYNYYYIEDSNGKYTTIGGKKCKKCYDYTLFNVKDHEKDINKYRRFALLSSKKVKFKTNYRVVTFDIETLASVDCVKAPMPIISIAAHDSLTGEMKYWDIKTYDMHEERAMLEDFYTYVSKFDVIAGFNCNKFDIPYLLNRGTRVKANISLISSIHAPVSCKYRKDDMINPWFIKIIGLNIVDLYQSSVRAVAYLDVKLPNNKLDTLAKHILGEQKFETDTPAVLFKAGKFDLLKEYNVQDVNITVKLDKKLGIIDLLISTLEFVPGLNLEEANYNSKIIDFYLLSKFDNIIFPSVNRDRIKDIEGAIVFDPVQGIHDNVAVYDIAAMYPSLIRSFNISPDMLDEDGDIDINGIKFSSKSKGILVKLVDEFSQLRAKYKKLKNEHLDSKDYKLYQLREFATKKILSSVYGVFGYIGFRLFNNDIANSITCSGRELLKHMRENAEKNNYEVVLGDTDSIFVKKTENSPDFKDYSEIINNSLKDYMRKFTSNEEIINNHKMFIEYETLFKRIIIPPVKKKYIGLTKMQKGKWLDEPQLYFKGSELNKKDVPSGLKAEIKKIVIDVLNSDEDPIKIIKERITSVEKNIRNLKIEDLLIYKEITRSFNAYKVKPQHVRAAENSNKLLGTTFSRDDYKGGILYVNELNGVEVLFLNDKVKLTGGFTINYDKYYNKFVLEKIRLIFGDEIYNKVTNMNGNLNDYMGGTK